MNFKAEKIAVICSAQEFKELANFLYDHFGFKIDRITKRCIEIGDTELSLKQSEEDCFGCRFDAFILMTQNMTKLNKAAINYLKLHGVESISKDDLIKLIEDS